MNYKFSLVSLLLMVGLCVQAEMPNAALVSRHQQAEENGSTLSIVNIQSIHVGLNDRYQVQTVFMFEDQSTVVFDDVQSVEFQYAGQSATIEYNVVTDIEPVPSIRLGIAPNPAKDMIHITGMKESSRGAVFHINGQRICDFTGAQSTLNVSGWANGTYIIRIDNEIFKLIKQ